ncbi:hypothetical protein PLICRDRAFT_170110 [Plicaturopsis crispa FD-325 SS-3]|nr:hypothetical protein PLICRDRAFT_170110 [Plicaturopsis crispa FD-325 SS-3]
MAPSKAAPDASIASDKQLKKEAQAKGTGVPQSTGVRVEPSAFQNAPVTKDSYTLPDTPGEGASAADAINNKGKGQDSKVGAAGANGTVDIVSGASTGNIPPELKANGPQ